ncbi:coagulation factor V-like, partial [Tiliqua scincoides]|uniref:coagulation factor V-like n=1 Tax=Tiliqua scincoides TaxID=71010 RepID=UPI0034632C1F
SATEGSSYSDRTSPVEKLDDAVPSGQMYTYVWEITEESGPRKADPPCLTYAYYSHVNMVQDFNSGLIGALLICKKGSLNENGTQKLFDREYVLMFAVFDESKNWKKDTSLMYAINGYANGTLPDVQACAYEHISWHLIGMSSTPEIFSIHFNGQTLEQNRQRISTVSLVGGASATANMTVSQTGKWLISSLVQKHLQAGMYGYLNIEDCGNADTLTSKLRLKEQRMINNWDYFIAAEEIVWDYAPEIPENIDREYRVQHLDSFSNIIGKKYKKAVFKQYKDATFSKRAEITRPKEVGILGPVIRAEVMDTVTITFKNMASRPYSIYVHGVTLSKAAEGAVYPSDSKENSTHGKAVQPGETYTYKWSVLDTDEPTTEDAECVTRSYHSAVDVTRDIASGLIGPLLICKRKALDKKGIQNMADVEQHAVFAVFDENKSWYLEDNIKEYCSNPSAVKREDPKFYKSNIMHTLNGYVSEGTQILGFCQEEIVEWHLTSVGAQDEIIPVHISGHTFLNRGKHQDILNLFPMSGESASVTMDNIGTWLLGTWDSREMSNGMRLKFRDVQCDHDYQQYDDVDYDGVLYHYVRITTEKPKAVPLKAEQQKNERAVSPDSGMEDYDYQDSMAASLGFQDPAGSKDVTRNEDDDYQDTMATMLGLRTFNGSAAVEEEQNLTALALQDTYNISSLSGVDVTVIPVLKFTNVSETLHSVKLLETQATATVPTAVESLLPNYTSLAGELTFSDMTAATTLLFEQGQSDHEENATYISDNYNQTLEAKSLRSDERRQSNDTAELVGARVGGPTSVVPYEEEGQAEDAVGEGGMDGTLDGNRERRALLEAKLHALREIFALLFHVQQKRNLSCLGNTTSNLAFLAIPRVENISSLDNLETDIFAYYYDETEEQASTELPMLLTNLTLTTGETAENSSSKPLNASEQESSEVQQHDNMMLRGVLIPTLIPKREKKTWKASLRKRQKCLSAKTDLEWNVVSEESDIKGADLSWTVDNELQNNSKNATMYPEDTMPTSKRNHRTYKGDSQLELDKPEVNNNQEVLNENCTFSSSGVFLKIKRKKKTGALAPRTHRPLETPKELKHTEDSVKANHTMLLNKTSHSLTQNQPEPFVRIGLPIENGVFHEYDIENLDSEQTSSGSFEYQKVHYDNPYTTDSRLDVTTLRNPDDIAVRYLRTFSKGNLRRYYIAAEEVLWDYAALRKSTMKTDPASTRYTKVIFRSYQDDTFRTPDVGGEYEEHLGILGPVIRAEVDDVIQVLFKNKASRPYSLHAHGLSYEKSSEGRSYNDGSPEWFKTDDAIKPNSSYTYVWHATKRSGPSKQDRRICRLWAYYSAVNPEKDIHSGLIGPILVCQKGMLDMFDRPIDARAFVLLFMVFNEEKSWYFDKHAKKTRTQKISGPQRRHTYPAINGISYDLPGLLMYKNEEVHWHMLNMGGPKDIHAINFHGQTFVEQEIEEHQLGVYPLFPGSFRTIEMKPPKVGIWLVDTEVGEYQEAGMQASFTVIDTGCKLPLGLESGIIQDSQIRASGHVSYWEPKLARLNNAGKYNAWSVEKKENEFPWIQVDLERQAVITGIQTQGAMQLTKALYTKEYVITYSKDGRKWNAFKGNHTGTQKLFKGNSDSRGVKENYFDPPIIARYIRVYPTKFFYRPVLRMELLGCEIEGCFMPLGMESGAIKNAQITASSYKKNWVSSWEPSLARLNLKGRVNAWQAKSNNNYQWLQVDLLRTKKISAITTQGAKSLSTEMYVKSFSIAFSDDGSVWKSYLDTSTSMDKVFTGNINSSSQTKQFFSPPIFSRFIRVIPKTWNERIVLRIELFGCDVFSELDSGMSNQESPNL